MFICGGPSYVSIWAYVIYMFFYHFLASKIHGMVLYFEKIDPANPFVRFFDPG